MLKTRRGSCSPRYTGATCPWPSSDPAALDTSSDRTGQPRNSEASNLTGSVHRLDTPFRRVGNSFKFTPRLASLPTLAHVRSPASSRARRLAPLSTWSIASQGQADFLEPAAK